MGGLDRGGCWEREERGVGWARTWRMVSKSDVRRAHSPNCEQQHKGKKDVDVFVINRSIHFLAKLSEGSGGAGGRVGGCSRPFNQPTSQPTKRLSIKTHTHTHLGHVLRKVLVGPRHARAELGVGGVDDGGLQGAVAGQAHGKKEPRDAPDASSSSAAHLRAPVCSKGWGGWVMRG